MSAGFGHRGADLFPEQQTVAATQPVHHLLDGAFGRPEALGHLVVAHLRFTARQIAFELLELGAATCLASSWRETSHRTLQNREGPPPLEERFGIEGVERLVSVSSSASRASIDSGTRPPPLFERPRAVAFLGQKVPERRQKERAKSALPQPHVTRGNPSR